jgi:ribonuclease HI
VSTTVYTDGACVGNPGPGGWAWAAPGVAYASGAQARTTNQRMELSAVLQAVRANAGDLRIISDSKYVVDCFRQGWHEQWERKGWKTAGGKPVANQDLWQPLLEAYHAHDDRIAFDWVKGHSDDPTNDIVDRLATEAARTQTGRAGTWPPTALGEPDRPSADTAPAQHRQLASIPGWRLVALGLRPPALGGYDPANPVAADVRRKLAETLTGLRTVHPDLHLLTGLALGAQQFAAEAAVVADVPYTAVLAHPHPESVWPPPAQHRYLELLAGAAAHVTLSGRQPRSRQEAAIAAGRRDRALIDAAHGALVVWDGNDRDIGENVTALNRRVPDDVWIVQPS